MAATDAYYSTTEHLQPHFALIYAPKRGKRKRFPENCVHLQASEQMAMNAFEPDKNLYPAQVNGPFISSEGLRLFYLVRWLVEV